MLGREDCNRPGLRQVIFQKSQQDFWTILPKTYWNYGSNEVRTARS